MGAGQLMSENTTETLIGALVLAVAAGFFLFASNNAGGALGGGSGNQYPLTASFRSAEGVSPGTDVRMAGVKIGTVTSLKLDRETYRANAGLLVLGDVPIPDDSTAVVASEGLLGGTFVEIVPGGSLVNLDPGDEIEDTQSAVSLLDLLLKYVSGGG